MRSSFPALVAISLCACTDGLTAPSASRESPEAPTARLEFTDNPERTAALALIDSVLATDTPLIIIDGVIQQHAGLAAVSRDRVARAELVRGSVCALYGEQRVLLILMVATVDSHGRRE